MGRQGGRKTPFAAASGAELCRDTECDHGKVIDSRGKKGERNQGGRSDVWETLQRVGIKDQKNVTWRVTHGILTTVRSRERKVGDRRSTLSKRERSKRERAWAGGGEQNAVAREGKGMGGVKTGNRE